MAARAQINPSERRDLQRDRLDIREERRDVDRAYRNGDPRQMRQEARELRGARQEFRYQVFRPSIRIGVNYYNPLYYINDHARYRLPNPGWNQRWVRHYNAVLRIDTRRGIVIDVIRGFYY